MKSQKNLCVIGGGVSGLSCAILLQKQGYNVTIFTDENPRKTSGNPAFSSIYPAASIIPHSISSEHTLALFESSLQQFSKLYDQQFPGLNIHTHFELFVNTHPKPDYLELMDNTEAFHDFNKGFYPKHPDMEITDGWKFNCYFADWSLYYPALINLFEEQKGTLKIVHLLPEDLPHLPFDIIINCSEMGARKLFGDEHGLIYRGHLIHVRNAPALKSPEDETISYNFSPGTEIYASEYGNPQDVYFYPRSDGWVLGGSRQKGFLGPLGEWEGEQVVAPYREIDGSLVPAQIPELHSKILGHTFGVELEEFANWSVKKGYRYLRKEENGLRLESEHLHSKLVIHNYGHGGAGVTLSWGCAQRVVELLEEAIS
ncbi:FAD-dependent oxidoreductase [Gracilimonas mengyeensis]|uniref:D-amino-acid oxidase n=1 Tax=Gracilimonas mengyeensis TaxID=1302730 RepID=A0A521C0Y9_9BACT|nr:FAD-dependent oxidoreductase [Gracilimonas mengyeensis]SMO53054.1 D-amino-acid:oxygen oxidoreductase [Gracilimonas mengyeensis]